MHAGIRIYMTICIPKYFALFLSSQPGLAAPHSDGQRCIEPDFSLWLAVALAGRGRACEAVPHVAAPVCSAAARKLDFLASCRLLRP
jgi:hypothetical protein